MSIFKETFKDFVFRQLKIREAVTEQGNGGSSRFGNPRSEIETSEPGITEKINIPKGAFYTNSVLKQCIIKMCSGVEITSDDYGPPANIPKDYILEGGILDNLGNPRSGFANPNNLNSAYGAKSIRSNADDGFGIVPMPGIIEASIRTKTAYGSLREANVSFVCHNRKQLEILELLYMRPGMPILLEWQWTPTIIVDEESQVLSESPKSKSFNAKISNEKYSIEDRWFDSSEKISDLNELIIDQKRISNGNYDGFIGFCKNFEIVSRSDGGYDCTTELIAAGEVLEGLKLRNDGFTTSENQKITNIDNFQLILNGITDLSSIRNTALKSRTVLLSNSGNEAGRELLKLFYNIEITKEEVSNAIKKRQNPLANSTVNSQIAGEVRKEYGILLDDQFYKNGIYSEKYLWEGEVIGNKNVFNLEILEVNTKAQDDYVRWDHLCNLINFFTIPLRDPSDPKSRLLSIDYRERDLAKDVPGDYLEFVDYTLIDTHLKEFKAYEAVIGNNTQDGSGTLLGDEILVEEILNNSFNPKVCLLPRQNNKADILERENLIGHIMLNVEHLKKVYNKMAYNGDVPREDFNFFSYLKKIWDDVNEACAGHYNFTLQAETERSDHVRIIDLKVPKVDSSFKDKLFEFKIQSNKSILRDFNFNTTIPSSLTATIAVAAQAPTSINDLDAVTFANWSRGIKSRFTKEGELTTDSASNKPTPDQIYDRDLERYYSSVIELKSYLYHVQNGDYKGGANANGKIDGKSFGTAIGLVKTIESLIISLSQRFGEGTGDLKGQRLATIKLKTPSIIPIKFNAIMDGISGFTIGNVFKIEKEKLPLGYQHEDIAFVVLGESQNITSGQDWTTEISGQLILLDKNPEEIKVINEKYTEELIIQDVPSVQDRTTTENYGNPFMPVILEDDGVDQEAVEEFFRETDGDTTLN